MFCVKRDVASTQQENQKHCRCVIDEDACPRTSHYDLLLIKSKSTVKIRETKGDCFVKIGFDDHQDDTQVKEV